MLWKKIGRMCSYKEAFINGCKIQTPAGTIEITNDVIATVVGGAATDIYGIVGMASKNQIKDNLNDILRRGITHVVSLFVKKTTESQWMSRLLVMVQKFLKFLVTSKKSKI